jgi:hypothetical protein
MELVGQSKRGILFLVLFNANASEDFKSIRISQVLEVKIINETSMELVKYWIETDRRIGKVMELKRSS